MSFFEELKRRNVFRVAIGYVITAWLLLQVIDLVLENINAPDWVMQVFMLALAIGFPLALFFAWAFEMTPEGVKREADVDHSQSIAPQTGRKWTEISLSRWHWRWLISPMINFWLLHQTACLNRGRISIYKPNQLRPGSWSRQMMLSHRPGTLQRHSIRMKNRSPFYPSSI